MKPSRTSSCAVPAIVFALLAGVALGLASCWPAKEDRKRREAAAQDLNNLCLQCHADFEEEELATKHQEHGVTCVRCHGPSKAHMDDEVRATPPDAIFRGPAMRVFCFTCHDAVKHAKEKKHTEEAEKAKKDGRPERTCTACHGEHKLVDVQDAKKAAEPREPATPGRKPGK
jgi:hypothetical protein